jgi:hypothetical protein
MDVLDVAGVPRERGRAHGEALRERIAVGLVAACRRDAVKVPGCSSSTPSAVQPA